MHWDKSESKTWKIHISYAFTFSKSYRTDVWTVMQKDGVATPGRNPYPCVHCYVFK